jgi:hypothetical protein
VPLRRRAVAAMSVGNGSVMQAVSTEVLLDELCH